MLFLKAISFYLQRGHWKITFLSWASVAGYQLCLFQHRGQFSAPPSIQIDVPLNKTHPLSWRKHWWKTPLHIRGVFGAKGQPPESPRFFSRGADLFQSAELGNWMTFSGALAVCSVWSFNMQKISPGMKPLSWQWKDPDLSKLVVLT